jgi:uncharacterized protein YkwD
MRHSLLRFSAGALVVVACLGVARPCSADPTAVEQYWLELINQARRDPVGELERLVNFSSPTTFASPASDDPNVAAALAFYHTSAATLANQWATLTAAPPLAWNDALHNSAYTYSGVMIAQDQQAHSLDGLSLEQRTANGGYSANYLDLGENLFATTLSVTHGHAGFMIDWGDGTSSGIQSPPTHRELLMDGAFKEIGIGLVSSGIPVSNVNATGPIVTTQHLGNTFRQVGNNFFSDSILTGVVFNDAVLADHFYTPGEGIAGTAIEVYSNSTNNLLFTGTTNAAGGYNIPLVGVVTGDVLRVIAPGTGLAAQLVTISGHTTDASVYQVPVTFYDNAYAGFAIVPEPGTILLLGVCGLLTLRRRRLNSAPAQMDATPLRLENAR